MSPRAFLIAAVAVVLVRSEAAGADLDSVGTIKVKETAIYDSNKKRLKQSRNMSGLLCPASDWCLLVSDEKIGIHRLKVDREGGAPTVSYDTAISLQKPKQELLDALHVEDFDEVDLEAVAGVGDK